MRLALIADIHGNAVALETVLAHIAADRIDQAVCLGDVALRGPEPHRALALVRALGCPVILGNTDGWLLDWHTGRASRAPTPWMAENDEWCARQLSPDDFAFLKTFRPSLDIMLDGDTRLRCFHGSPRSFDDNIFATTGEAELRDMLMGCTASVLAGGHTHIPLLRYHERQTLINPVSIGQTIAHVSPHNAIRVLPCTQYAVIRVEGSVLGVEFRRVAVDVETVIQAAFDTGMPAAAQWATQWRTGMFPTAR